MLREYGSWSSPHLCPKMESPRFGDCGLPLIMFPASMGGFYDHEDRGLVASLADEGRLLATRSPRP